MVGSRRPQEGEGSKDAETPHLRCYCFFSVALGVEHIYTCTIIVGFGPWWSPLGEAACLEGYRRETCLEVRH